MVRAMALRSIGRWLYHKITSAKKRPYINLSLESLELSVAKAADNRDIVLLFGILDELKYRVTSPSRRDELIKSILSLLKEFEGISINPDAAREQIAKARQDYLREVDQKATEEKKRRASEARVNREAEDKAQREEADRKEAIHKAKEEAAEKARLRAEDKAQREEADRKEAEHKAKEAAAEEARLEAEAKAQREEAERKEAERKAKEEAAEKARLDAEAKAQREEADRKAKKEERRELARLRRLERDGKAADHSEDEVMGASVDVECEEAEQFAPYLREIPAHWSDWSEQHWNIKLLDYCFVQKANENSNQGIPSTEEDLAFVTADRDSAPADMAQALVDRVREFSFSHGLSPARLLIKRLETWDNRSPSPPRYFAFLWTTCLIAQGFPSPFEQGEFHKRYGRDDVYGANETQFLSGNLPAAWLQLSKWLDRDDIFDAHVHRRLVLPKTDPQRSIISHSWKLSFPCRSDRRRLHDVLGRDRKGHASRDSIDLQLISNIYNQGGFTPEFTAALKQQIDLVQKGNQAEEWFSAIIHREIEAQDTSQVQSARKEKPKEITGIAPKIILHLDDEDCYLELVLSSQSVAIEKPRRLSQKTSCTLTLETKGKMAKVVSELDIDDKREDLIIPDIRVKVDEEQGEYVLKLRHEGLDNAVLAEWSCEGLAKNTSYILFNSETNETINKEILNGSSLSLLFRRNWDVVLSNGIEAETEDPISVSRLGGWRLLLLAKTSPLEKLEKISLANVTGEKLDICWVDSGDGNSNRRPLLKGLRLPGQATGFIMLADNPEVWLPPGIADAQIEMFKIEDDEFYIPIGSIEVPSTACWQQAGVRKLVTCPGLYSVRLSYFDNSSAKMRKWSKDIILAEEPSISCLHPASLQARYRFKETSKVLDLERDVSPFVFQESQEFWNAVWLIRGL
jgi:hypothetical protein